MQIESHSLTFSSLYRHKIIRAGDETWQYTNDRHTAENLSMYCICLCVWMVTMFFSRCCILFCFCSPISCMLSVCWLYWFMSPAQFIVFINPHCRSKQWYVTVMMLSCPHCALSSVSGPLLRQTAAGISLLTYTDICIIIHLTQCEQVLKALSKAMI